MIRSDAAYLSNAGISPLVDKNGVFLRQVVICLGCCSVQQLWTFLDFSLHCGTTEASFMKNWRTTSTIGRFIRFSACLFCLVFWVEFIFSWRLFGFLDGLNDSVKLSMLDVRNSHVQVYFTSSIYSVGPS